MTIPSRRAAGYARLVVIGESLAAATVVSAEAGSHLRRRVVRRPARRLADGGPALNVAAAPLPAPCPAPSLGKKVYAKPLVKKDRWSSGGLRAQPADRCFLSETAEWYDKDVRTREQKGTP